MPVFTDETADCIALGWRYLRRARRDHFLARLAIWGTPSGNLNERCGCVRRLLPARHTYYTGQTNDAAFILNAEHSLDIYLCTLADRCRYTDLKDWEQERLQEIKRHRTRHRRDGPTNELAQVRQSEQQTRPFFGGVG